MKNWSIAKRIQLSLMTAIGMVLIIGFLSFFYIYSSLNLNYFKYLFFYNSFCVCVCVCVAHNISLYK